MAKKENSFSGWLQRVRKSGEFSDVTVVVEGEEFRLHMLPLLNASSYFRNLPSSSKAYDHHDENSKRVELRGMAGGADGFSTAADFCYLIKPIYTLENVARIRAVAEFLGMTELLDSTKKFLYLSIFSRWNSSVQFLRQYQKLGSPVDDYVESRCLKVISAACIKAFFDTKHLSVPIPVRNNGATNAWQSSPCQTLGEILASIASLPDSYVVEVIKELVNGDVNLNLKCRQGRNVKDWLDNTFKVECRTDRARCWVLICLTKMLEKSVTSDRPWLELSSQYWCNLLENVSQLIKTTTDSDMVERLKWANSFLEQRIGGSLHELDDYLQSYNFELETLLRLVKHFKQESGDVGEKEMEEVASEADACLWNFLDTSISAIAADDFISFIQAFPAKSRPSHDLLYAAIEKIIAIANFSSSDKQKLWSLVDITKLNPACSEKALNNPSFLCQPHVLQYVLQQHSEELSKVGEDDRQNLKPIMQKVIRASLKLLEENSRRSKEIMELKNQYTALVRGKISLLPGSSESSPDVVFKPGINGGGCGHGIIPDEVEEAPPDTPAHQSTCSSMDY